jgi:hypothetical protein
LFVSKKKGLIFGITVLGALLVVCLLVRKFFPCYFLNTILENISNNSGHPDWKIFQLESFNVIFAPIIMIFFLTNKIQPNKPFVQSSFDYRSFFLIGSVAIVVLLGQNRGNYLVYLFQLMNPALIILAFKNLTSAYRLKILIVPLIILNLAILCFFVLYPNSPLPDTQWQEVNQLPASPKLILNSPILMPEMVRLGIQPID